MPWLALRGLAVRSRDLNSSGTTVIATLLYIFNGLTLSQGSEAVGDDVSLVYEQVVATTVGCDEAVALGRIEPSEHTG